MLISPVMIAPPAQRRVGCALKVGACELVDGAAVVVRHDGHREPGGVGQGVAGRQRLGAALLTSAMVCSTTASRRWPASACLAQGQVPLLKLAIVVTIPTAQQPSAASPDPGQFCDRPGRPWASQVSRR